MTKDRISGVRQIVGVQTITLLAELFEDSNGCPPGTHADRYRADHPELIDLLDRLEGAQLFLRRQQDNPRNYQLTVFALPLVESERSSRYIQTMEILYVAMQGYYRERLSEPVTLAELIERTEACGGLPLKDDKEIKDALFYLVDGTSVWSGRSKGFPYDANSTLSISEFVLRHPTLLSTIEQFYDWHILNPRRIVGADVELFSADDKRPIEVSFFRQSENSPPAWYEQLDDTKKALIAEVDTALHNNLSSLPTMGLRALLESIILDHIDDRGVFKGNIEEFVNRGFMTSKQADVVSSVVDAGNAAVHRAYFPNREDILLCVEVVKHLAHGVYILGPQVDELAAKTPRRPSKGKPN